MRTWLLMCLCLLPFNDLFAQSVMSFGEGGQLKMLYDRRQRPQSVYLDGNVHIVFNGGGKLSTTGKYSTRPMAITYDPAARNFFDIVTLGPKDKDHHFAPVIWADRENYLHVLFGCHRTSGTHLISKKPGTIGSSSMDWKTAPQIAPGISYPTFYRIFDNKELIYYRTDGHYSSWTYRISGDNGQSWTGPDNDVVDLDSNGALDWSSYHSALVSADGNYLHVAFIAYDDNKNNPDPRRFYNPRYDRQVSYNYNLYYIKIDLRTGNVVNDDGEVMQTPIDLGLANAKCRVWDTQWRGGNAVPTIVLDKNGEPCFLHVISEKTLADHNYYFVRRENGKWKQTPVAPSTHEWNSCHLKRDASGTLRAYLITGNGRRDMGAYMEQFTGDGFLDTAAYMDRYGGGENIEEWISSDNGNTWKKARDLTPDISRYPGWKYNNIQPVTKPDGSIVDGMLLFYGWTTGTVPEAKAFLLHED